MHCISLVFVYIGRKPSALSKFSIKKKRVTEKYNNNLTKFFRACIKVKQFTTEFVHQIENEGNKPV